MPSTVQLNQSALRYRAKAAALFFAACILAGGCRFDADYQHNIKFPASLIIVNEMQSQLVITAVLSLPEAASTFVLNGGTLRPGASLRMRITEGAYQVLLDGAFVLRGACGGRASWEVQGNRLVRQGVQDGQRWDVTVPITVCVP